MGDSSDDSIYDPDYGDNLVRVYIAVELNCL